MIKGTVTGDQQALVSVDLVDSNGLLQPIEVILDTGFTGYLTLPTDSIQELGLPSVGRRTFELANGGLFEFEAFLAAESWHGRLRDAIVLQSNSAPLLGMTPLWGSRVTVDALADGQVTIEELQLSV
ncbi:MAG: hypothetical protein OXD46_15415 [Chloroflexi bacterium]|nr:hypothetical protein [Chloroflexota bacterium]